VIDVTDTAALTPVQENAAGLSSAGLVDQVAAARAAGVDGADARILATCIADDLLLAAGSPSSAGDGTASTTVAAAVEVLTTGRSNGDPTGSQPGRADHVVRRHWLPLPPWRAVVLPLSAAGGDERSLPLLVHLLPAGSVRIIEGGNPLIRGSYVSIETELSALGASSLAGRIDDPAELVGIRSRAQLRLAAYLSGVAEGARRAAIARARERRQFGRPIGFNQAVAFPLATSAAHGAAVYALITLLAEAGAESGELPPSSAVLALAADQTRESTAASLHVTGAHGLTRDSAAQHFYTLAITHATLLGSPIALRRQAASGPGLRWFTNPHESREGDQR
jgi:hypothetical protein